MIPTLGPKICKCYLHGALWIRRVTATLSLSSVRLHALMLSMGEQVLGALCGRVCFRDFNLISTGVIG